MALRQSIPHLEHVTQEQLAPFFRSFEDEPDLTHFFAYVTEKTDGSCFSFGIDQYGFFTQTAYQPRRRYAGEYWQAAKAKFGADAIPSLSLPFDAAHAELEKIFKRELEYRWSDRRWDVKEIRTHGELFARTLASTDEKGRLNFVGTAYNPKHFGTIGMYVFHRYAHVNPVSDWMPFKPRKRSTSALTFDTDVYIDRGKWAKSINFSLNVHHGLGDGFVRELIVTNLDQLKLLPKWGSEREGFVLHNGWSKEDRSMIKVIDPKWKQRKEERWNGRARNPVR